MKSRKRVFIGYIPPLFGLGRWSKGENGRKYFDPEGLDLMSQTRRSYLKRQKRVRITIEILPTIKRTKGTTK